MKTKTQNSGGFEYVVAALNLKITAKHKKNTGRKKRGTRKPDGTVRSATKFILIVLANHRNHKTGQCNPAQKRLADLTGHSKRTIVFELQALKELGIAEWVRGWGNDHGKVSSRYTLNLARMQELGDEVSAAVTDEGAAVTDEGAAVTDEGAAVTLSKCTPCNLTSKEPPILEPPRLEPSATQRLFTNSKTLFEAEEGSHLQSKVSAPAAPSSVSAPAAPSSDAEVGKRKDRYVYMSKHGGDDSEWRKLKEEFGELVTT